jgi:penicillin-insensitive murein endopeptidase
MTPARKRTHGHPLLLSAIRDLAASAKKEHLGLLGVGDLGQPRGGPAPSGHASHQSGLDVDLWYRIGGSKRKPTALALVEAKTLEPTAELDARIVRLLELAASDTRVARLFVHPSIKRALCARYASPAERAWLHKVRPWWGHDHHFHLRLACPADSPECVPQEPIAPGDGCDEMTWWFSESAKDDRQKQRQEYKERVGAKPPLPATCQAMVTP